MPDLHDDDLRHRFLLGDVTPVERERVEGACEANEEYFDSLCALEEEMLVQHLSGELPDAWRGRFVATLPSYPERRRRLEELAALRVELSRAPVVATTGVGVSGSGLVSGRRPTTSLRGFAIAAVWLLVAGAGATWLLRGRSEPPSLPPQAAPRSAVTFVLAAGQQRSDLRQANVFPVPRQVDDVQLQVVLPSTAAGNVRAALVRVGNGSIDMSPEPAAVMHNGGDMTATWRVPAALLPRGDYLLTITTGTADATATVASAFFSVVE